MHGKREGITEEVRGRGEEKGRRERVGEEEKGGGEVKEKDEGIEELKKRREGGKLNGCYIRAENYTTRSSSVHSADFNAT